MSDQTRPTDTDPAAPPGSRHKLARLLLDPASVKRGNANIEHEREVAIFDILEANEFEVLGRDDGPYELVLGVQDDRLVFTVTPASGGDPIAIQIALMPLRRVMKDYFLVCETYFDAIRTAPPSRIQQIDIGRRALHDEGAKALTERLSERIRLDTTTARRLFTLICALHWRG
jgi:uncharacterized protein (UPF0262 family)